MEKWLRYMYMPILPLGEDKRLVTGSREHIELSRQTACEGMVLLKNEESALPLPKGAKVALFGKACADYVKGGGGSGDVTVAYVRQLCDAMEAKEAEGKVTVFKPLHDFYRQNIAAQRAQGKEPGYTDEPAVPGELLEQAARQCDTAIISICRYTLEAKDRQVFPNDGDFYLSLGEQKMVEDVKANFDNIIVVLNVCGMVDSSWFRCDPKIKAVLLGWQGGIEGATAKADILCGDVCPSGKLVDTFAGSFDDYPSSYNFNESPYYKEYTEDIYVGYRYFETVPGAAEKVNYPFGFGLSYTTFDIKPVSSRVCGDTVTVELSVTNTGSCAGKEVVQLYSAAPAGRLDTPALELRGFKKTKLLAPGQCQQIELTVKAGQLASYDESKAAYILLPGAYKLLAGNCIRSLTQVAEYVVAEETVTEQLQNRCLPRKLSKRMHADGSYEALTVSEYDPRPDTEGWPSAPEGYDYEHILPDLRQIGPNGRGWLDGTNPLEDVADGKATVEEFLAQLSTDDLITLLSGNPWRNASHTGGIGGLEHYGMPSIPTADGPAGLRFRPNRGITTTAWPVATLLACTWNEEAVAAVGAAAALEVKENNIGVWLTPGVNIHRNPQCGRNFEYYSEDPLVTGKIAAAMIRGIQSRNISACIKHYCCNNTEVCRTKSDSIVSERALREIYLRGFEIAVKEAGPWALMTAYNIVNGTPASESYDLITGVLREEWGYDGIVVTDWANGAEQYLECKAGNDVRMPSGMLRRMQRAVAEGRLTREDMLKPAARIVKFLLRMDDSRLCEKPREQYGSVAMLY